MSDYPQAGYFDRKRSASYERRATRLLGGLYRLVASDVAAFAPPGGVVLDVGTGPGRLLHAIAARRADLVLGGVDLSADMVDIARAGAPSSRITFQVADVASLPYSDDSVDVVVSTLSMHEWPDRRRAVAELGRVLRPGGALLVYDFRFARIDRESFSGFADVRRVPVRPKWWPAPLFAKITASVS
ncbi:class I SAM-dependent methyltransferase [Saccharothrix luteola]|uniref:class I SAM-dependent methyltransferase n=1 Tax=Saccharothrix luteola TaxID=2893018 RepID=UPI001E57DC82|nr:class I SAM-dependent methyltransferase [Saccharothrix luteola]MCC8246450.1 class I SAM-dependent methyltransferase [Saccharothrix luteola]